MSMRTPQRDEHVDSVFLRAIGGLSLASYELSSLRRESTSGSEAWDAFADHLLESVDAVLEGAAGSSFPGNTIAILRDGVRVPVGVDHLDRLTDKIHRHVRVGRALGVGETDEALTLTA